MSDFNFQVKEDGDVIAQFVKRIDAELFQDALEKHSIFNTTLEPINEQQAEKD